MGALTADRQALAVAQAPIAGQIHEALDVHSRLAAQITLDPVLPVDRLANLDDLLVGELIDAAAVVDADPVGNFRALAAPMPWMYCNAITTRLLVGMLTPAIRATRLCSWTRLQTEKARLALPPGGGGQRADRALSRKTPL